MSDELQLLFRPLTGYRRLARRSEAPPWRGLQRPLVYLLAVASMISLTTAGRLALPLVVEAGLAWSFVPLLHLVAAWTCARLAGRPASWTIDLYFAGFGPWWLWLVGLTGAALFLPGRDTTQWHVGTDWLLGSAALAFLWSAWIQLGFFRGGLGLSAARAATAVVLVRAWTWGFAALYFHLSDQLVPRLPYWPEAG